MASPLIAVEEAGARTIDCDALLQDAILRLKDEKTILVLENETACGVITRDDLHKPAVRMWLFGMLTMVDANVTETIGILYPGDKWASLLPEGRVAKARSLCDERKRIGQPCPLIDCLHLVDKFTIVAKDDEHLKVLGYESRRKFTRRVKALEDLRNALVHRHRFSFDERFWDVMTLIAVGHDDILQATNARKIVNQVRGMEVDESG
jgi:hypothetical protein